MNTTTLHPKTILISVSNKEGLIPFLQGLVSKSKTISVIASDGTYAYIKKQAGKDVLESFQLERISSIIGDTYSPSGRVRSLGFALYAAILEPDPKDLCIDVVYCDVYDFQKIHSEVTCKEEAVEGIDIGGISMLRAAAKNYERVLGIVNATQRERFLKEFAEHGEISFATRLLHAGEIFSYTAEYDRRIAEYFSNLSTQTTEVHTDKDPYSRQLPDAISLNLHYADRDDHLRYTRQQIHGEELRYGDNPDQIAGLYTVNQGHATFARSNLSAGNAVFADIEQVKQGKVCSKTNISDIDAALHILRNLTEMHCVVILKHGNPCGAAIAQTIEDAFIKAWNADRIAAFGGVIVMNRPFTSRELAREVAASFFDAIVAPSFSEQVIAEFEKRKSLSLYALPSLGGLDADKKAFDLRTYSDGSIMLQDAFFPGDFAKQGWKKAEYDGKKGKYAIARDPSESEWRDLQFGWYVQAGTMSNSILFVKDGCTIGIAAGEQDRVGAAAIARDKAYRNRRAFLSLKTFQQPYETLDDSQKKEVETLVIADNAGLQGATMVSDGFFPFRDGVDIGLQEGVKTVLQPGGSIRDYEVIQACNEYNATMVFTNQRSFKH